MSTHLQAKLLHVLQESPVFAAGRAAPVETDVRAGGNERGRSRSDEEQGRFREDLYYRLNVLSINVPPLRERTAEIPLLFRHFLQKVQREIREDAAGPSSTFWMPQ